MIRPVWGYHVFLEQVHDEQPAGEPGEKSGFYAARAALHDVFGVAT